MSFRLLNTECFIFSGISDGKGLAAMKRIWFEKNFPKLNLQPSFLDLWHVLECLLELIQFYHLMQVWVFIFIW